MSSFFRIGVTLSFVTVASFALVSDYRYTECSGTTIKNYAGEGLEGKLSSIGATLTSGESTLSLTGKGSMRVEHDNKLDLTENMSISIWVKQSKRGQQALITRGEGEGKDRKFASNAEYFLTLDRSGKIQYKHNGISGTSSQNAIPLNQWTHIVITRNHLTKKINIYINGDLDSTYTYNKNPVSSKSEKLLIGSCPECDGIAQFKGKLDEIKLYNKTLSNQKVIELFDAETDNVHQKTTCKIVSAPIATDDKEEVYTTDDVEFNVLDNDIDNDTDDNCNIQTNSVVLSSSTGAELSDDKKRLRVEGEGVWSVQNNGVVKFTPNNNFTASPHVVSYQISDNCNNQSNEATITLIRERTAPTSTPTITPTPIITPIPTATYCDNPAHGDNCGCECETYESSVSILNRIGIGTLLLLSTFMGMFLFRKETLLKK